MTANSHACLGWDGSSQAFSGSSAFLYRDPQQDSCVPFDRAHMPVGRWDHLIRTYWPAQQLDAPPEGGFGPSLGLVDARPMSLTTHTFVAARLPNISQDAEKTLSVTVALSRCGIEDHQRKSTRITASLPEHEEAARLNIPRNRPVLWTENINITPE